MQLKILYTSILLLCLCFQMACTPAQDVVQQEKKWALTEEPMANRPTNFQAFQEGIFKAVTLDKEPMPIGGERNFYMKMYKGMNYPPEARERGVGGTVLIKVTVNEFGQLENAAINQGIGAGCDEVALEAVRRGCQVGFEPAMLQGKAVKVKYDIPVVFRLE